MVVKQVSVFVQNEPGRLEKVTKTMGDKGINIRAFSIAEMGEFGIIRLIVDKPVEAKTSLKDVGLTVRITEVLAIEMGDSPGSLGRIARILGENKINIDYAYAFVTETKEKAVLIARVDDNVKAERVLKDSSVELVKEEELYSI